MRLLERESTMILIQVKSYFFRIEVTYTAFLRANLLMATTVLCWKMSIREIRMKASVSLNLSYEWDDLQDDQTFWKYPTQPASWHRERLIDFRRSNFGGHFAWELEIDQKNWWKLVPRADKAEGTKRSSNARNFQKREAVFRHPAVDRCYRIYCNYFIVF